MDRLKPHKGSILNWSKRGFDKEKAKSRYNENPGKGYYIIGIFVDHPEFASQRGNTSWVVSKRKTKIGYEIETRNSRYTLVGEESV